LAPYFRYEVNIGQPYIDTRLPDELLEDPPELPPVEGLLGVELLFTAVELEPPVEGVVFVAVELDPPVEGAESVAVELEPPVEGVFGVAVEVESPVEIVSAVAVELEPPVLGLVLGAGVVSAKETIGTNKMAIAIYFITFLFINNVFNT
jgi:hypothetical protein